MVKLPQTPPEWDAQATNPPQQTLPSGPDNASGGLLGGLQSPDWSLENSGLGFLLHPQTVAQMDLGQGSHTAQPVDAQAVQPLHWSAGDNSVHLSNEMSNVAESVGREFSEKTGRNLVVTGGARTPARQAEVMYDKFKAGDRSTYKGPSGSEVLDIYNRGTAAGQARDQILQSMATTIQAQKDAGHPVSRHLDDQALDFQSKYLTDRERAALQEAIRINFGIPLVEGTPLHIHGSFPARGRR